MWSSCAFEWLYFVWFDFAEGYITIQRRRQIISLSRRSDFFLNKILVDPANIFHFSSGDDKKPEMHCRKHCIVLEIMQCNYNAPTSSWYRSTFVLSNPGRLGGSKYHYCCCHSSPHSNVFITYCAVRNHIKYQSNPELLRTPHRCYVWLTENCNQIFWSKLFKYHPIVSVLTLINREFQWVRPTNR